MLKFPRKYPHLLKISPKILSPILLKIDFLPNNIYIYIISFI